MGSTSALNDSPNLLSVQGSRASAPAVIRRSHLGVVHFCWTALNCVKWAAAVGRFLHGAAALGSIVEGGRGRSFVCPSPSWSRGRFPAGRCCPIILAWQMGQWKFEKFNDKSCRLSKPALLQGSMAQLSKLCIADETEAVLNIGLKSAWFSH